jgi:protein translocase SecG subunit
MGFLIGFFTFLLVVDCLFLILLILVQLPKKEAGMGQAFGGAATDALFGAGSGTALTKLTKYATGFFLGMTLLLTVLNANQAKDNSRGFEEQLNQAAKTLPPPTPPPGTAPAGASNAIPKPAITNLPLTVATNTIAAASNQLLTPGTSAPVKPATAPTNTAPPPAAK